MHRSSLREGRRGTLLAIFPTSLVGRPLRRIKKNGGPPPPLTEEELDASETETHNFLRRGAPKEQG